MADGSQAKANLRRRARRAHERAMQDRRRVAQQRANKDTGAMARSVQVTPTTGTDRLSAKLLVPDTGNPKQSDKARWTDQGTAAHVIRPRRAKVLVFKVGGRTVFARRVQHPGYPGSQWFGSTVREWGATVQRAWRANR